MPHIEKTVTVELLRHGSAHNQLLSPLTKYLGLCGNFGATLVRVPYEHQQFLSRLQILRYSDGQGGDPELRKAIITETAQEITVILESLRGLISELGTTDDEAGTVIHLNLVLSAAELAMLPFELSNVPPGCAGGEGSPLLLQNRLRVSMTRQVRNITNINLDWPKKPKILFIVAAPGQLGVPIRAHTRALLDAIAPWVSALEDSDRNTLIAERSKLLTIIKDATREKISNAVSENQYTHVHILAHGMADKTDSNSPYGLALHDVNNENLPDIVDGQTLASLLCPLSFDNNRMPSIVTVASCDSGNTRSVINSNGSSLAHELHRAGVPFVVASQFPLSKKASKYLPRILYPAILWGDDPRIAVVQLRDELKIHCSDTHDWASVVCYASLPENIDHQLRQLRHAQSKGALDAAMNLIDILIADMSRKNSAVITPTESEDMENKLKLLFKHVKQADERMPTDGGYEIEGMGMKASTHKRKAESFFKLALLENDEKQDDKLHASLEHLKKSKRCYEKAYQTNFRESNDAQIRRSAHWVLGQYLSVCAIIGEEFQPFKWGAAKISCDVDLKHTNNLTVAWAHGTMAELNLLLLGYTKHSGFDKYSKCRVKVLEHISSLIERVDPNDFAIESTLRQFRRYTNWWGNDKFRKLIENSDHLRDWSAKPGVIGVADEAALLLERAQKV